VCDGMFGKRARHRFVRRCRRRGAALFAARRAGARQTTRLRPGARARPPLTNATRPPSALCRDSPDPRCPRARWAVGGRRACRAWFWLVGAAAPAWRGRRRGSEWEGGEVQGKTRTTNRRACWRRFVLYPPGNLRRRSVSDGTFTDCVCLLSGRVQSVFGRGRKGVLKAFEAWSPARRRRREAPEGRGVGGLACFASHSATLHAYSHGQERATGLLTGQRPRMPPA
jgi:hypothetical protein